MDHETIIGLEVHIELSTQSKIFCSCRNLFGGAANHHCCPVCLGLPGALPVLNEQVVEYALRLCLATDCQIESEPRFDRKNYFYPDLPKAYQISQLHRPIGKNGHLTLESQPERQIGIQEIHMEEDAGKLAHDPWSDRSLVDYNRCGVPLLEIVSKPDLRHAKEAIEYLTLLRQMAMFLNITDGRMEQGSLRADVNVSVRPRGTQVLGTRTEMKNMSSFKAIERAIEHESSRQSALLSQGETVIQETRRWDENKDRSFAMRSKEDAQDYRYFPDPDLTRVPLASRQIEQIKANLPQLPQSRRRHYVQKLALSEYEARQLTTTPALSDLFEALLREGVRATDASSWLLGEILSLCAERSCPVEQLCIDVTDFAHLLKLLRDGAINRASARKVLLAMIDTAVHPQAYIEKEGLRMLSSDQDLAPIIRDMLAKNPQSIEDFRSGKTKAKAFLVGQVMRQTKGKADPAKVHQLLDEQLKNRP